MAFYYHAPMVNCLEAILPELPTKVERLKTNANLVRVARAEGVPASARSPRTPINIDSTNTTTDFRLRSRTRTSDGTSPRQDPPGQTLVLVPTINRLPETLAKFPSAKNYAIYHSELKTTEKFTVWKKILEGRVDFVFGSRSAIFTPCPKLSKIIIFDEHDGAYKDERSPYFDTLTIAEKLMQITGAKLQIIDPSPKIATYFSHQKEIQIPKIKVPTTLVSMIDERNKGNKSAISDLLSSLIIKTVRQKGKVLLFLNKKRESGQVYCKACRFHEFAPKPPQVCPNCQSPDIYFNMLNIESLAATVHRLLPNAQINLIAEGTHYQLPTTNYPLPTIDIATASVFYRLSAQKYDLVAHILSDTTLNIADFTSGQKTLAQVSTLKNLAAKNGRLILQTYNPDHPILKNAAQNNYLSYFAQSLAERKALNFPPFALLIKLTIKGKDKETLEKKAQDLTQDLTQFPVSSFRFPVSILGPYESIFSAKVPSYNIILKHKLNTYSLIEREKARQNLEIYLQKVPRDFQITIEPANIN